MCMECLGNVGRRSIQHANFTITVPARQSEHVPPLSSQAFFMEAKRINIVCKVQADHPCPPRQKHGAKYGMIFLLRSQQSGKADIQRRLCKRCISPMKTKSANTSELAKHLPIRHADPFTTCFNIKNFAKCCKASDLFLSNE